MKKMKYYWVLLIGLLSVVVQIAVFYMRFGKWNTFSSGLDYLLFFLAGTLGGLILIYFLNRQESKKAWNGALIAFLLVSPVALVMMVGGGLLGPIGVLVFPQIPWALFTWIGGLIGKFLAKNE